ncbi:MAG: hypothetical protein ACMUHX_01815 [bacterium]
MLHKKTTVNLFTFIIILQIILFSLFHCPGAMCQTQSPFLSQTGLPFIYSNTFLPFTQTGYPFAFNTFNNRSNLQNIFLAGLFGQNTLPIINQGLSINPYLAASTYYAAALLPVDVVGAWSGTWTSTSTLISVSGDINLTMVQATNEVAGTLIFLTAGLVKLACPVVGIIDVDILSITGSGLLPGKTPVPYEIVLTAGVTGAVMEGEYIITETLLGNVVEQGTFTASKL